MRCALFLLLLAAPGVLAGEREEQLERVAIARLAFDARLRLGYLARDAGRRAEALEHSAAAADLFLAELEVRGGNAVEPELERPAADRGVKDDGLERLRMERLAIEAQLKIGDVLRQKGDADGARAAYEEALRISTGRMRGGPAVRLALAWLAAHQDEDGRWDCDGFMKHDPPADACDGAGGKLYDVGVSGLALLAFLRAGAGTHAATVRKGMGFLIESQDAEGCIGTRVTQQFMYSHAIATLALCEGYRATRDPRWKKAAEGALRFIEKARNPYLAWRYEPRGGENDTSVTGWCVLALEAGRAAGLAVDADAFRGALAWVDKMTEPNFGQVGYNFPGGYCARPQGLVDRFPPEKSQSITAVAISVRIAAGEDPHRSIIINKCADLCRALPPTWNPEDGSIDMYYWFHGAQAMARIGGDGWARWRRQLHAAILGQQHAAGSGARAGSWDPVGPWGPDGGRVYSTALMALSLLTEPTSAAARAGPR